MTLSAAFVFAPDAFADDRLRNARQSGLDHLPDRLLVRLAPAPVGCTDSELDCHPEARRIVAAQRGRAVRPLVRPLSTRRGAGARLARTIVLDFDRHVDVAALAERLRATPGIEVAEPDWIGHGASEALPAPSDPYFPSQWALEQPSDADVDIREAWAFTRGRPDIAIAVLDSGVAAGHLDFEGALVAGFDFVNDDDDPADDFGHGTHVAGVAAARSNDGVGVAGVCPECSVIPVKVLDDDNVGLYSWWISGIVYAVDNDARVVNLSAGGMRRSDMLQDGVRYAHDRGVPVVAAMMNFDAEQRHYPAAFPEAIAVGATDRDDSRASPFEFAAGGTAGGSNFGEWIDLVAPGNLILGPLIDSQEQVFELSGTSQAAPLVSGTIALLLSLDDSLGPETLRALLTQSAVDRVGRPTEDLPGFDAHHGWGRLHTAQAIRLFLGDPDVDDDGVPASQDCNDTNVRIHPLQPEITGNAVDDDCNPETPDSVPPTDIADAPDELMAEAEPATGAPGGCCVVIARSSPGDRPRRPWLWWVLGLAGMLSAARCRVRR